MAGPSASASAADMRLDLPTDPATDPTAELAAELAAARRERDIALETIERRTRFFAAASHDLRQPLHAVSLLARALNEQILPAETHDLLRRMGQALGALEGMFDDLLDLSKVDTHGLAPDLKPVRLQAVYDRVGVHAEPEAFDKGLALRLRGGHHWVLADPVLLERMLRNLVHNAIRYTDDGGVLVAARPRGGSMLLQVWDSGQGIAPEVLPRLFDPFVQADGSAPRHGALGPRGFGLGLSIVKRLAEAQGTGLSVRTRPGCGTVLSFALKAAEPDVAPTQGTEAAAMPTWTLFGQHVGVWVADASLRELLAEWLTRWRATVSLVDGTAMDQPDLLLTDQPEVLSGAAQAVWREVPLIWLGSEAPPEATGRVHALPLPVAPNRLRALMAYKLAGPSA
jgi:two-component sensor histidine kinase